MTKKKRRDVGVPTDGTRPSLPTVTLADQVRFAEGSGGAAHSVLVSARGRVWPFSDLAAEIIAARLRCLAHTR